MSPRAKRTLKTLLIAVTALATVGGTLTYVFNPRTLHRYTEMEARLGRIRAMNKGLERANERLALEIEACRTDPRYVGRLVRHELGQIPDDAVVYLFPPMPEQEPGVTRTAVP